MLQKLRLDNKGGAMRLILRSIVFEGFQSLTRKAEVHFSNSQTSIVFGSNGCGKTTFLKLIHAVLSKSSTALQKEQVSRVIIEYVDSDDVERIVKIKKISPPEELRAAGFAEEYDWSEFDASDLAASNSLSLGVERGVSTQVTPVEPSDIFRFLATHSEIELSRTSAQSISERLSSFLTRQNSLRTRQMRSRVRNSELQLESEHSFLQNIKIGSIEDLLLERYRLARNFASEKIQSALFDTLSLAIDSSASSHSVSMPNDLGAQIIAGKDRIIEALDDGNENNFKSRIINILLNIKSESDAFPVLENAILSQLIWNMLKELKVEKQLLNSINIFVEFFNRYLGDGKELEINSKGVYLNIGDAICSPDVLSSGERHLFTFLALVVIVARDRNFLIIDEPEISLNATWQRSLVEIFEELAPDTQIILASHSPILAKGRPWSLVELNPVEYGYAVE